MHLNNVELIPHRLSPLPDVVRAHHRVRHLHLRTVCLRDEPMPRDRDAVSSAASMPLEDVYSPRAAEVVVLLAQLAMGGEGDCSIVNTAISRSGIPLVKKYRR